MAGKKGNKAHANKPSNGIIMVNFQTRKNVNLLKLKLPRKKKKEFAKITKEFQKVFLMDLDAFRELEKDMGL